MEDENVLCSVALSGTREEKEKKKKRKKEELLLIQILRSSQGQDKSHIKAC